MWPVQPYDDDDDDDEYYRNIYLNVNKIKDKVL
jgi:hypothetical protein